MKKKRGKDKKNVPGGCSVARRVRERKGAAPRKKGQPPPSRLPARGGSRVPVKRRNDQQEREKKKKKYMPRCWVAEVQK